MMRINSDASPNWYGSERIKLKSEFIGEKPYIYAKVNGKELLFLLDTGARFPILMDTEKVKTLPLPKGFDLALGGWGEQEDSYAYQSNVKSIDLGGVVFENMNIAVLPISKSYYYHRADESFDDGVIGHDIMKFFTWEFDAANNEIYISRNQYQPESHAQKIEMETFFSKLYVKADLAFNQEHATQGEFIIDTGSRHYLKVSAAYLDNNKLDIDSARVQAADFGLSGKVEHERVTLPSLTLGEIKLNNVKVNLIPNRDEDELWIIGNALMNQFKTVIDYQHNAFYLVTQQPFVTDYNLFGLELRKINSGEFVVRYVFPELPASKLNIEVGDLVTSIDGKVASEITLSQYNDLASTTGLHQVCIERDNNCFTLDVQHIAGYSDR